MPPLHGDDGSVITEGFLISIFSVCPEAICIIENIAMQTDTAV